MIKINEIFYSIQGEGKWSGKPCIFIRTTGCNLRCSYCDTKYAYEKGTNKTIQEIIKEIEKYNCKKICLTGGEPLQQKNTKKLIERLLEKKYQICLETNGSKDIYHLPKNKNLMISLDIKCPSSNMHKKMNFKNIKYLQKKDQIKFVVKNKKDYNYTKKTIKKYYTPCSIYLQPEYNSNTRDLIKWVLDDDLDITISLQIHKIIWGENHRKV